MPNNTDNNNSQMNFNITKDIENKENSSSIQLQKVNKKRYINLYFCKLSVGLMFAYIFIICSITINIVNRIIFWKYKFNFYITLIFLQQFFCMIFFLIVSKESQLFKRQAGIISFKDFWKLKFQYIGYSVFFVIKTLTSFIGYQLVTNIPMYVNLRKFLTGMTFVYEYFFKKKKISKINILEVVLLSSGALLSGIDDYTTDIKGYIAVFLKNTFNLVNLEVSENFKKKYGVSNLKLLVYNSFISTPFLFITIFIKGEFKQLITYFTEDHDFEYFYLFFYLFISCSVVMATNTSFFISNEKNSSLFTQLISDTKYIFITLISYLVLKSFTFTWKNITGLCLSTLAAIIITITTLFNNIQFKNMKKRLTSNEETKQNSSKKNIVVVVDKKDNKIFKK